MRGFPNYLLPLWMGLLWSLAGCRSSSPQSSVYPVRYTAEVDWPKGKSLEQLKDFPVGGLNHPEIGIEGIAMNKGSDTNLVTARSWREFCRFSEAGYEPADNANLVMSGWFVKKRGYIPFLEKARPCTISYVHELPLNWQLLKELPIDLGPLISDQQIEQAREATKGGKFWIDFFPAMKITKCTKTMMELEGGGDSVRMRVMAYGDYNHDGYEDVLLYVAYEATEGTLGFAHTVALTRTGPHQPLREVGQLENSEMAPVSH